MECRALSRDETVEASVVFPGKETLSTLWQRTDEEHLPEPGMPATAIKRRFEVDSCWYLSRDDGEFVGLNRA